MAANYTSPGVYVEEISSGVRTITGVATSRTAFIGRARRGATDTPSTINSYADFERLFGGLWNESPMSFAVRDYFLNGGVQAIVVRLYRPRYADDAQQVEARAAADGVATAAAGLATPMTNAAVASAGAAPNNAEPLKSGADAIKSVVAAAAGAAGVAATAVVVPVEDGLSAAEAIAVAAVGAAGVAGATPAAVKSALDTLCDAQAALGGPRATVAAALKARVAALAAAGGASAASVRDGVLGARDGAVAVAAAAQSAGRQSAAAQALLAVDGGAPPHVKDAAQHVAAAASAAAQLPGANAATVHAAALAAVGDAAPIARARIDAGTLSLEAASEGAWGNALRVRIDHQVKDPARSDTFNLAVRDRGTGETEVFRNVSVKPDDPRFVERVLASASQLLRVRPGGVPATRPAATGAAPAGVDPFADPSAHAVVAAGAAGDGLAPQAADYRGSESQKRGLYQLEHVDLFNLLCIPPAALGGDTDKSVWAEANAYCRRRRAMLLIDPPAAWADKSSAIAGLATDIAVDSSYAAIFFPRLRQANPERDGQIEEFTPCGAVAGVIARTDATRGVWKAPAGLDARLQGVDGLTVALTDAENGELNPLGINCLRTMPAAGRVVWGARTREGDDRLASEWKYIPVRRTALYIEESLYRGTQWVVFEPNDEPLWAQIRLNLGAFMHGLFRQGAFEGTSPREAYFVKCDRETTTQADINLGIVNILIGFAPLKPAEFVVLKIQQMAGQLAA